MRPGDVADVRAALEHAVRQPPFADVVARSRRVRRRRRTAAGVTALGAAVLAVAVAQPVRRVIDPPPTPPGPTFAVQEVEFTDRQTGYVITGPCAERSACTSQHTLARTTDGGRTWQRLTLPAPDPGPDETIVLHARGRQEVSLLIRQQRFVSRDGGHTWQQVDEARFDRPVETVPEGHMLLASCVDESCPGPLAAVDVDGTMRPLVHQPRLPSGAALQLTDLTLEQDGPLWMVATDDANGRMVAVHSADRGRTWTVLPAPRVTQPYLPQVLALTSTPRAYLVVRATTGGLAGVWRLDDPDRGTWTEVTPDGADQLVDAQELPNGELRYVTRSGGVRQTRDGGTAVGPAARARVDGVDVDVVVHDVVDGTLVGVPVFGERGDLVLFSTDNGAHWQVRPVRL